MYNLYCTSPITGRSLACYIDTQKIMQLSLVDHDKYPWTKVCAFTGGTNHFYRHASMNIACNLSC